MRTHLTPPRRVLNYALVAALAFTFGAAGTVAAARPIDLFRLADATDDTRAAKVDAAGNVAVSVSNLPATQAVSGTVSVANFPATQAVSGTVQIGNQPTTVLLVDRNPYLIGTGQHFSGDMISVAAYSRIAVSGTGNAGNPNTITITLKRRGSAVATLSLSPGGSASTTLDIVATDLEIDVHGGPSYSPYTVQQYTLQIWAR